MLAWLLARRDADGRYPERLASDDYLLPLAEYTRRAIVTGALARGLFVVCTNSDGNGARRREWLDRLGPGSTERVIDPGVDAVRERLARDGVVSKQCEEAYGRWYNRLDILSL